MTSAVLLTAACEVIADLSGERRIEEPGMPKLDAAVVASSDGASLGGGQRTDAGEATSRTKGGADGQAVSTDASVDRNGGASGDAGAGGRGAVGATMTGGASVKSDGGEDASADGAVTGYEPPLVMISSVHAACDGGVHGCTEPLLLATVSKPWAVAVDVDHVYWTESVDSGAVKRIPIGGGTTEPIATGILGPTYLTLGGNDVFWVDQENPGHAQMTAGRLMQVGKTGGTATQIASSGFTGVACINSDGQNVYYYTNYNILYSVPVGGGPGKTVFGGIYNTNVVDIVLFAGNLYWTNNGLWKNDYSAKIPGTASVDRIAVSGQTDPELVVQNLDYPIYQVAADGQHAFYNDAEFIYRTGATGGRVTKLVQFPKDAGAIGPVTDMASDGTELYFSDGRALYSVPVVGGTPLVLSWGWQNIQSLAVDAKNAYFVDTDGGFVVQVPKYIENKM
jgi:hypothetical protein